MARVPHPRRLWRSLVLAALCMAVSRAGHGDPAAVSQLNWIFDGAVRAVARSGDTLYVGGDFTATAPSGAGLPPLWAVSGTTGALVAPTFPGFDGDVVAVEPDGAGGYFVGGTFTRVSTEPQQHLAHVFADGAFDPLFRPVLDGAVRHIAVLGAQVYLSGDFSSINGTQAFSWGAVTATTGAFVPWRPLFSLAAVSPSVFLAADGRLVVGGGDGLPMASSALVAAFDPASGVELWRTDVAPGGVRLPRGQVHAVARVGPHLLVSHTVTPTNGGRGVARLSLATGAIDAAWQVRDIAPTSLVVSGTAVYLGGVDSIAAQPRRGAAAVDLATATALPWNPDVEVGQVLAASGDGGVFVMAVVDGAPGMPQRRLARVDGGGAITAWAVDARPQVVTRIVPGVADTLIVVGGLTATNNVARSGLAAFSLVTGDLLPWGPLANGPVTVLAVAGDRVTVGGGFSSIDEQAAAGLAAVQASSGARLPWPSGPGTASFVDDRWIYVAVAQAPGGAVALERYALTTGVHDPSWRGPRAAASPLAAAFDAATLYVASASGVTALDRRTARLRWHHPAAARTVTVTGDTVYADSDVATVGTALVALDARSGRRISAPANRHVDALAVADGRLIAASRLLAATLAEGIYGLTFDGAEVRWHARLRQTLPPYGFFRPPLPVLQASSGLLVVGGSFGSRTAPALQGLAVFPLEGARAPSALRARPRGALTEFTWLPTAVPPAGGYVLEAGLSSAQTIVTVPVGDVTRYATTVPPGRFHIRVRAIGASGAVNDVSNEIVVSGGCSAPPPPPTAFAAVLNGTSRDRATFSWTAPDAPVTSYLLVAGSSLGRDDVAGIALSGNADALSYASAIPPGTYHLRLRAANACGPSPFTPSLRLTVGAGDQPGPPSALTAVYSSGGVTLSWAAPPGPVTGYTLEAGSDVGLADVATVSLGAIPAVTLPPASSGVYVIRVRAVNEAGTGAPSDEVVVRLP